MSHRNATPANGMRSSAKRINFFRSLFISRKESARTTSSQKAEPSEIRLQSDARSSTMFAMRARIGAQVAAFYARHRTHNSGECGHELKS
jgi:hypothetical protein